MHLADFGADVLRVEAGEGDRLTPAYIFANRNKQLIDCDVRSVDGRRQAQSLIQRADVLFIDGSAERLDDLSCDAESLCGADPRLVHVWMPPHATRGAVSALPPDELLLAAWTGMADQQPGSAQQPVAPVVPILGYEHGALAASAAAAALLSREARGSGGAVTVSGLHAVSALNVAIMVDLPGMIRPFSGPKKAAWGPANFRMYRCRDGTWLFLAALTAPFFIMALNALELMDVMLLPGIDGEFTNIRKPEMNEMVSSKIAERMIERDRSEWQEVFDGARVPNGPIQVREEWAVSETVAAEEMLVSMPHNFVGEVGLPDVSIRLRANARAGRLAAGQLGGCGLGRSVERDNPELDGQKRYANVSAGASPCGDPSAGRQLLSVGPVRIHPSSKFRRLRRTRSRRPLVTRFDWALPPTLP